MARLINFKIITLILTILFFSVIILFIVLTSPQQNIELTSKVEPSFIGIFTNNLQVALLLICLGPLTFGVGTIVILLFNAAILGSMIGSIKGEIHLLKLLIPHGILEIPVLIISATVGIMLLKNLMERNISLKPLLKNMSLIITGLFLAAFIEVFITTLLI